VTFGRVLDEAAWQDRLERLTGYSFFATPTWGRMVSGAGLGYRHQAFEFELGETQALLPVVAQKRSLGRLVMHSGPFGTYGGLIPLNTVDKEPTDRWAAFGTEVGHRLMAMSGFGVMVAYPGPRPHIPFPNVFSRFTAFVIDLKTQVLDPATGSIAGMRRKTRQYVHKAERAGVEVSVEDSPAAYEAYYELLLASNRRWGRSRPNKPWATFASIQRHSDGKSTRLWMARVEGKPAAGLLCFYGMGEVFAWSSALDEAYVATRANYLLHSRAITDGAARGFETFNLGANENLSGVQWFKEGFGAQARPYPAYVVGAVLYRATLWGIRRSGAILDRLRTSGGRGDELR